MTISWYGHSCFKITNQGGHLTMLTDPFNKSIGLTPPRVTADIITVSHDHADHNNIKSIGGNPFIINGPGEYELKGVKVLGLASFHDQKKGAERGLNTIYLIEVDRIKICHLGDLGEERLSDEQIEALGQVDILLIPVGGTYLPAKQDSLLALQAGTIGAKQAIEVINQIDPKLVIPMHYQLPNLTIKLEGVEKFLKEIGLGKQTPVEKLTLKKKDLDEGQAKVIVMKP